MDGPRFDDLTRAMAHGVSRRGALGLLLGGAATVARALAGGAAEAREAPRPVPNPSAAARKPPGFERLGKRCGNGQPCGVHVPCNGNYCLPVRCWIGGQVVDNLDINDDNTCQRCFAHEANGAWSRWSQVPDGQPCAPGDDVEVCETTFAGTCRSGECVPAPLPDGTECGPEQVCCQGDCCAAGLPCSATAGCGGCDIGGDPIPAGDPNPGNACQRCDALVNPAAWSPTPGTPPCGDAGDRVCCNGECCPPDRCCSPAGLCEECCENGEAAREDGTCEPGCDIAGVPVAAGTPNPAHDCEVCDPEQNPDGWSPVDGAACGGVPGRVCCNGECCSPTECCDPAGFCDECGPHCRIDGQDVDEGAPNPNHPCEACDPEADPEGWSPAFDGDVCGADLGTDLVCCGGACCGSGLCCVDGACGECRCTIGDRAFDAGETEPGNTCNVCAPDRNPEGWTAQPRNAPCGLTDGRFCCAGICCPQGQCCNQIGECAACGCEISDVEVLAGSPNPANTCQVCNPGRDRTGWTTLDDDEACGGDGDDRVCCGGACCPQGQCCTNGACRECGCEIDGASYEPGTINPHNTCQVCAPSRARLAWSAVVPDGGTCGSESGQTCCDGECCAADECCLLGACGTCLCSIDGDNVAADTPNPANPCEVCDPRADPFAWSPAPGTPPCGETGSQVCCAGICCPDGDCCSEAGACETCGCTVEGQTYAPDAPNPANACQVCKPDDDPAGWSPLQDDSPCGELGDRVCCLGECCAAGQCCTFGVCGPCGCQIDGQEYAEFAFNPANPCEWCDPVLDPLAWSPRSDEPCGGGAQVCCTGVCCAPGQCCGLHGACEPCETGCTIDGVLYADGAPNPAAFCQLCTVAVSASAWSPRADGTRCGADDPRVCCAGVCGPDTCSPTVGCTIGGVFYENGAPNPDNPCEHCSTGVSPTAWSPVSIASCGPNGDRFCSGGVCCDLGICPDLGAGACGDYCDDVCVIGGTLYRGGDRNPANPCEACGPQQTHTAWFPLGESFACDPITLEGFCCGGACCNPGSWCSDEGACVASDS